MPELPERVAVLESQSEALRDALKDLTDEVKGLRQDIAAGKGGLSVLMWAGGILAALLAAGAWVYDHLPTMMK